MPLGGSWQHGEEAPRLPQRPLSQPGPSAAHRLTGAVPSAERWGRDWALLALAAADNTALCLEHYCDALAQ